MQFVTVEKKDMIATIRLERAEKLNALTPQMIAEIGEAFTEVEASADCRAIVLAGSGRAFCVGADVRIWSSLKPEDIRRSWISLGHRTFSRIEQSRLPVVAAVQGMAFGGGLELALAADIRVLDPDAQVALPEVSIGTIPGWGGTQRLPRLIGLSRAKLMALTGRRIDAETALAWGLATEVSAPGESIAKAYETAREITRMAPISAQLTKSIVNGGVGIDSETTFEMLAGIAVAGSADAAEGIAALLEKRKPVFRGE